MATVTWTGERVRHAGLLYQNYEDLGQVRDDCGILIGEILRLPNGYYQPRVPGLRGDDKGTAVDALAYVVYMHKRYRS